MKFLAFIYFPVLTLDFKIRGRRRQQNYILSWLTVFKKKNLPYGQTEEVILQYKFESISERKMLPQIKEFKSERLTPRFVLSNFARIGYQGMTSVLNRGVDKKDTEGRWCG